MPLLICGQALQHSRNADVAKGNVHEVVTREARVAARAIKEGFEIVLAMVGMFAIVVASLALDVWIWIPRLGH
jgi:hypothetical protein